MSPDEPSEVIGNLPSSRPSRANPRRDAARAKAAAANGAAPPKATAKPKTAAKPKAAPRPRTTAAGKTTGSVKGVRKTAPAEKLAARPKAAAKDTAKAPIPPAGYAVPGAGRSGDPAELVAEALRAAGGLVQGGADVLLGLLGRR